MRVKKKNDLNNCEFYLNSTSKTPSNVRISLKGNVLIKTSKVLLVLYKLISSRPVGGFNYTQREKLQNH